MNKKIFNYENLKKVGFNLRDILDTKDKQSDYFKIATKINFDKHNMNYVSLTNVFNNEGSFFDLFHGLNSPTASIVSTINAQLHFATLLDNLG